jgi:hypothetical protein
VSGTFAPLWITSPGNWLGGIFRRCASELIGFAFRISDAPHDFDPDRLSKCRIPASVISLIEGVQPYHVGKESLGLIKALVDEQKHRLPVLTIAFATTAEMPVAEDDYVVIGRNLSGGVRFELGADGLLYPDHADVGGDVAVFLALKDAAVPATPVDVVLEQMAECVAEIIPIFEPLF